MIIKKLTTFLVSGRICKNEMEFKEIKDMDVFFDSLIRSEEYVYPDAKVQMNETSLYISYLDVKNTNLIDRLYLLK